MAGNSWVYPCHEIHELREKNSSIIWIIKNLRYPSVQESYGFLVGGFNPSEKKVSWDDYSQYMEKKKCFKPPTSFCIVRGSSVHHPSIPQDQRSKKTHGKTEPQCRSGYWMGQVPSGNLTELLCSWPLIC
jgi:hypothetical protein